MSTDSQLATASTEEIAHLKALLEQSTAEIARLKVVHAEEIARREQIENELQSARSLLQLVMDTLPEAIFWKDKNSAYLGCNQNFADDAGVDTPACLVGKTDYDMVWKLEEADFFVACDRRVMHSNRAEFGIVEPQLQADGKQAWLETNKVPLHNPEGEVIGILGTYQDITERKQAEISLQQMNEKLAHQTVELTATLQQLQESHLQLVQQEKMSALGNLVAGVAHEMNNPVGFLTGNLRPAQNYTADLFELIELYQETLPEPGEKIEALIEDIDLDYIREDMPQLLQSMERGLKRIRDISNSLRTFSRSDQQSKTTFDVTEGLDSTLLILKHRLKADDTRPTIQVTKQYGQVPPIECFPGQLNQVFMNLLANAIDALDEASQTRSAEALSACPNRITVSTRLSETEEFAIVQIKDNGTGMNEATKQRAFENLFTTKAVGKGTGLGLAIAHQIVVEKHSGTIEIDSALGEGTQFTLKIPVK